MNYRIPQRYQDIINNIPSEADRKQLEGEMSALYREAELFNTITLAAVDAIGVRYDEVVRTPSINAEVAGQIMTTQVERALEGKYLDGHYDGRHEEQVANSDPDEPPEGWEPEPRDES